jgi:poly-gamma-glutamate synthesis protein (capsule biosynthesis protein)
MLLVRTLTFFFLFITTIIVADEHARGKVEKIVPIEEVALPNSETVSVRFLGDIMLGRFVETLLRMYGESYILKNITHLPETDFVVANFESSMTSPHVQTPNYTFRFATKSENISILKSLGVTHASLANNHAFDYGVDGYNLTKTTLLEKGIIPFGHPTTHSTSTSLTYIEKNNKKIALIGIHTLFAAPSNNELTEIFKHINQVTDYQIVYIHWGDEYQSMSNRSQQILAKKLIELGADAIIGHHPHVVQEIAIIDGVAVFYSLGNFIFDQYFSGTVMDGLVVDVSIHNNDAISFTLHPVTSRDVRSQPRPMNEAEEAYFLRELSKRSDSKLVHMIQDKYITLDSLAIAP